MNALSRSTLSFHLALGALIAATLAPPVFAAPKPTEIPPASTPREIEIGEKAAKQLEKQIAESQKFTLLDGSKSPAAGALLDKLNRMAAELGKASARPLISYQVKVIESPDVNAFTIANGHIYIYRGLLDLAGSDDEIAGVLAHEIGHNARMHALRGEAKAKPLNLIGLAAMLAVLAGRSGADVAAITPYILTGVMSGYTVEYEKEADQAGIEEMAKTKYNASAMVTFMNRLTDEERRRPKVQLGIFEDHPPSPERVAAALAQLSAMGIAYTPRDVQGVAGATVTNSNGHSIVKWNGTTLIELAAPLSKPDARAAAFAKKINDLMRADLRLYELTVTGNETGAKLLARGQEIIAVSPADAKSQNTTPLELARQWKQNFARVFWSETLKGNL